MRELKFKVRNKHGLHLRPATEFIKITSTFDGNITIRKSDEEVDAKSVLGILTLGIDFNDTVFIKLSGNDEDNFIKKLEVFFNKEDI